MSINVKNIKRVRKAIATHDGTRFDMRNWPMPEDVRCGTAACIGGWTEAVLFRGPHGASVDQICERLGITKVQSNALFFMEKTNHSLGGRTRAEALAVLDRLIETGEVDWDWAIANPAKIGGAA